VSGTEQTGKAVEVKSVVDGGDRHGVRAGEVGVGEVGVGAVGVGAQGAVGAVGGPIRQGVAVGIGGIEPERDRHLALWGEAGGDHPSGADRGGFVADERFDAPVCAPQCFEDWVVRLAGYRIGVESEYAEHSAHEVANRL
jgi:hypothetical protein